VLAGSDVAYLREHLADLQSKLADLDQQLSELVAQLAGGPAAVRPEERSIYETKLVVLQVRGRPKKFCRCGGRDCAGWGRRRGGVSAAAAVHSAAALQGRQQCAQERSIYSFKQSVHRRGEGKRKGQHLLVEFA
jgi:hypothetical protein